jgi:hypothetical protein
MSEERGSYCFRHAASTRSLRVRTCSDGVLWIDAPAVRRVRAALGPTRTAR